MSDKGRPVADIVDDILDLPVGWQDNLFTRYPSVRTRQAFTDLIRQFCNAVEEQGAAEAAGIIHLYIPYVKSAVYNKDALRSLGIPRSQRSKILATMAHPGFDMSLVEPPSNIREAGIHDASSADVLAMFEQFLLVERELLREAGLNQQSVETLINAIVEKKEAIAINVSKARTATKFSTLRSIDTLRKAADYLDPRVNNESSGSSRMKRLSQAKEKITGLAVLWANCVPLLLVKDWGVASVVSAAAGATVACIVPSNGAAPSARDRLLASGARSDGD